MYVSSDSESSGRKRGSQKISYIYLDMILSGLSRKTHRYKLRCSRIYQTTLVEAALIELP